jgi:hypothetical protein
MEKEFLLPVLQGFVSGPYPVPDESCPHPHIVFLSTLALTLYSHLHHGLPSGRFPSGFTGYRSECVISPLFDTFRDLSWARTGSDRHGTARRGTVRGDKTQWKEMEGRALHQSGSAQTPSARIGTVRNTGQSKTFRRSEACGRPMPFSKRRVLCVFLL